MSEYEVGVSAIDITPPVGTPIGGNLRSDYASRGVFMPLLAQAMVVRDKTTTVALAVADLLTVSEEMVSEVRRIVSAECDLEKENILVAAIHTHAGPATLAIGEMASPETLGQISRRIAAGIVAARNQVSPSEISVARFHESRLSFNRRLRMKDGSTRMNWEQVNPSEIDSPLGPTDAEGFLIIARRNGKPAGMLVNFPLHPAVFAGNNWDMNPDWPGFLREALVRQIGAEIPILYFNGAQGNINHLDAWDPEQGRGRKEAQRIGYVLANTVAASLRETTVVTGPVAISNEYLSISRRTLAPDTVAEARNRLAPLTELTPKAQEDGMPQWFFDQEILEFAKIQDQPVSAEVQVIRIGNIALVGLPGEFFVEWGLQLKKESPFLFTVPLGLANGALGYIPIPGVFEQGGYESMTWRYNQLDPAAGEQVVASAARQLIALFEHS